MNAKTRARTIAVLEKCVADSTRPAALRRAATLRLSRLRSAATATRTTAPAPEPAPSEQAKFEAVQSFRALAAQRSALMRKRRSRGEQEIFAHMIALMPGAVPSAEDQKGWSDFVARIDATLSEIKSVTIL
jgi:hypothetical protein